MEHGLVNQGQHSSCLSFTSRAGLIGREQAHPEPNTLYVQVGDADLDNAYWGGDQGIPGNRTSFPINATQWVMSICHYTRNANSSCFVAPAQTLLPRPPQLSRRVLLCILTARCQAPRRMLSPIVLTPGLSSTMHNNSTPSLQTPRFSKWFIRSLCHQ